LRPSLAFLTFGPDRPEEMRYLIAYTTDDERIDDQIAPLEE
jgi:hypothetical protein